MDSGSTEGLRLALVALRLLERFALEGRRLITETKQRDVIAVLDEVLSELLVFVRHAVVRHRANEHERY